VFSGPKTREVTEIGLLPFILAMANEGGLDYTLLPIFPLRVFRHKSIFIRRIEASTHRRIIKERSVEVP
jgi:4,5-dihydroxyphthalate decarboxylase